jgi:hypothetical protein
MHALRLLSGVAALSLMPGRSIAGQDFVPRPTDAPPFAAGDTIRVWMEPSLAVRVFPSFQVGVKPVQLVGAVVANWAPDSVNLRRTALILYPWESRHRTVFWGEVEHLDVANGRVGAARGAAAGLVPAAMAGLSWAVFVCAFGGKGCGWWFFRGTAYTAIVTVPLGAVWGAFTPRWKRAY